jgi:hypothetical protein
MAGPCPQPRGHSPGQAGNHRLPLFRLIPYLFSPLQSNQKPSAHRDVDANGWVVPGWVCQARRAGLTSALEDGPVFGWQKHPVFG